jgi:flagellar motor switch protein FliM
MDTSTMDIDLQPLYVRCNIKGKITQLVFEEEILVERSSVQRSQTTGALKLTMPKARINEIQARNMKYAKQREERAKQ